MELKKCRDEKLWQFLYHLVLDIISAFRLRPKTHMRSAVLCRSQNNSVWFWFDWNVQHYFVSLRKTFTDIFVALTELPKKNYYTHCTTKNTQILFSREKATQNFLCTKKTTQNFTCMWPEHSTIASSWMLNVTLLLLLLLQKKCEYHRTCCDYLVVAACQDCSAWNERKKLQHFYQLVVNMVWDLWKSYARTFRCLALLRWWRTSSKGAMWAIVGSNFYCPVLKSKSPLICIVGKQLKDHKSRSLNYCFFANQRVLLFAIPFLPYKGFALTVPFEDCQVRMFAKQG